MAAKQEFHHERFNVDTLGMRQLHQNRQPEQLVKELVQNVFDEEATTCRVTVETLEEGVMVTVEDDGPGFRDIRDAYTLMGDTPKRMNPEQRGRFNMGEKELISIARWARVETTGSTVEFPEEGGRTVRRNRRKRGTAIRAMMPWSREEAERLIGRMMLIRPPLGIDYRVNRKAVRRQDEIRVHSAILDTVIQETPGSPMRPTRRRTDLHILPPGEEGGWIYEMGIPIQQIELGYSVDVMQKVPMPPNRDTVSESYLKRIYTEVLNAMHDEMQREEFSENWVRTGVENPAVEEGPVRAVIQNRYGEKVVTWSSNTDANMKATDAGYQVLHPRSLGKAELENMRKLGGLLSANDIFGREDNETREVEPTPEMEEFAEWVRRLGRMAGKEVAPVFIHQESRTIADCSMNTGNPTMRFNTRHLEPEFFAGRGEEQMDLVIHELGHAEMSGEMSHGNQWGEACCRVGSRIAMGMAGGEQGGIPVKNAGLV